MKTKILGISGKKQSGKNTATNFILGIWMKALGLSNDFKISSKGELVLESDGYSEVFDIYNCEEQFKQENLNDFIRVYSFADVLKQSVCMDILGLTYDQCYGTDEQKNTPTHLLWENMPGVITEKPPADKLDKKVSGRLGAYYDKLLDGLVYHAPGVMTAREVMQFAGTEIFRKMYINVWVDATIRAIHKDNPVMAIICDTRFINEVEGIQAQGGKVGRLTRDVFKGKDQHESETALDNYDTSKFDFLWDNERLNIEEQNKAIFSSLQKINWIPKDIQTFYMGS